MDTSNSGPMADSVTDNSESAPSWTRGERRTTVYVFSNLKGLARYFGRVMPIDVIQEEVKNATRTFNIRARSSATQTQLEFLKLCETRLVKKARDLRIEV